MSATLTVTGTAGPGFSITAGVFANVSQFTINCETNILSFTQNGVVKEIAITAATTITATKSGSTYTLVIS